jgi:hypothetical protein
VRQFITGLSEIISFFLMEEKKTIDSREQPVLRKRGRLDLLDHEQAF